MPKQRKQIGQRVFKATVEHQHFAADLLPPCPLLILGLELKVAS